MNVYESATAIKRLDDSLVIVKASIEETQKIETDGLINVARTKIFFLKRLEGRLAELEQLAEELLLHVTIVQASWLGDKIDAIHDFNETIVALKEEENQNLPQEENDQ